MADQYARLSASSGDRPSCSHSFPFSIFYCTSLPIITSHALIGFKSLLRSHHSATPYSPSSHPPGSSLITHPFGAMTPWQLEAPHPVSRVSHHKTASTTPPDPYKSIYLTVISHIARPSRRSLRLAHGHRSVGEWACNLQDSSAVLGFLIGLPGL